MSKPRFPADHPLKEYADYMINSIEELKSAVLVMGIAVAFLAVVVGVVVYFQIADRKDRRKTRQLINSTLKVVADFNALSDATTKRVGGEIKDAIKEVPDRVIDKIDEKHARCT